MEEIKKMQPKGQVPNADGQCYCEKQQKWMRSSMFYTYKDGTMSHMCKKCLTMHIDNFDPDTFTWLLKEFDVPWIPSEWNTLRDKAFAKDPNKAQTSSAIFGKYLSKMKLKQWNIYGWADTEKIQEKNKVKDQQRAKDDQVIVDDLRKKLASGEITEAQYQTLMPTPVLNEEYKPATSADLDAAAGNPFQESQFIDEKDMPDPAADLTDEDKIKLAVKWGRLYKPNEWIQLEKDYRQMINSFDIQDADTKNSLILICKLNLKVNQCLDRGDYDGFTKLSRELSSQRKLANFAAIGRKKDVKEDFVTAIGEAVAYCEKTKGRIPRLNTDAPRDIVDKEMQDDQRYLRTLIKDDPSLSREIEDYIKKRKIQDEQKQDQKEAESQGLEQRELTDQDMVNYQKFLTDSKAEDQEVTKGARE